MVVLWPTHALHKDRHGKIRLSRQEIRKSRSRELSKRVDGYNKKSLQNVPPRSNPWLNKSFHGTSMLGVGCPGSGGFCDLTPNHNMNSVSTSLPNVGAVSNISNVAFPNLVTICALRCPTGRPLEISLRRDVQERMLDSATSLVNSWRRVKLARKLYSIVTAAMNRELRATNVYVTLFLAYRAL